MARIEEAGRPQLHLPAPRPQPEPEGARPGPLARRADRSEPAPARTPFHTPTSTPTPTPPPSATPPATSTTPAAPAYLAGRSEAELASLQQRQPAGRNDCADYSIAAALNLLFGGSVRGSDVAAAADQVPRLLPGQGLRLWENGPTTPAQQANIVNGIARQGQLPLSAVASKATTDELVQYLQLPDAVVIVTIGWDDARVPQIARSSEVGTAAGGGAPLQLNAHAMVLAAYDPSHLDHAGNPAPWGFVNSWADGGSELYWMPDADFQQAWSHGIPLIGSHNAVVITREPTAVATTEPDATATPGAGPTATPAPLPAPAPGQR